MRTVEIVEITNIPRYGYGCKQYGVIEQKMQNTIVVNFGGYRCGGMCINIAHGDYRLKDCLDFVVQGGKIYLKTIDGFVDTDLKYYD